MTVLQWSTPTTSVPSAVRRCAVCVGRVCVDGPAATRLWRRETSSKAAAAERVFVGFFWSSIVCVRVCECVCVSVCCMGHTVAAVPDSAL